MEALFIVVGALVAVPVMFLLFAVPLVMWSAWWLQPLWTPVLGPLGMPPLDYWHFVAFELFFAALSTRHAPYDRVVETDSEKLKKQTWAAAFGFLVAPIASYYLIRWSLY